ncbi:alpha-2-macroglobulin family protein [Psychroserpens damuponensis]|uniref:alpha-2-macroglobulin family protein n=1 Tax=Psychroserpens damuponensis TaxID=943936 RepID=UPI00058DAE0A|nr:MG2 domain-containing protein [Psychroserpens damuponensis]
MKPIISALMILLFANFSNAQPDDYAKLWQEVEAFEQQGLPKSALKIVKAIEKKAKASNNAPQEVKTLLFRSKYALILEDEAQFKIISEFKDAIAKSESPTKNVLQNMLATLYWQYFTRNRWKFYNRTKISASEISNKDVDFRTWDLQTLFEEIHKNYKQSLQNGLILQQTKLDDFEAIISSQTDSKIYRPTLFDLLSHHALNFYKTSETNITRPAYKFEIDNPKLIGNASDFALMQLTSKDTLSLQFNALKIYQNLIKFHLKDESPQALADVNLDRLTFITQHAIFDNKEELLLETLNQESKKWNAANNNVAALYDYEIAKVYQAQGQTYQPKTNETHRWKLKEAMTLCDAVLAKYPKSKGAQKCAILKSQILAQSLQIFTEDVLPINEHALSLITYKNSNDINFKIGTVSDADLKTLRTYNQTDEKLEILNNMKAIESWTSHLKDDNDYQQHRTEIALPKLKNGRYIIYGQVQNENKTFAFKEIQVSNLAYIQKEHKGNVIYQIIDRTNGKPISDAKITLEYIKNYNDNYKTDHYTTNNNGEFVVKRANYNRSKMILKIKANNDTAYFDNLYLNRYYNYGNDKTNYPLNKGFIFTDRSIYRPGQPLYFKGIVMTTSENKTEILTNTKVDVTLYNTNGEDVKSLELTTNEFGSVSGEFIIPNNGLTGNFSIRLKGDNNLNAYQSISVEEYKRPKFEAKFTPVTKTYKVNDTVTVNGNALAYAGSNITDAKVVYRVHRNVQYPRWYYWYRPHFNIEPQEITHGETTTDADGKFKIDFKAIPDAAQDKSALPTFSYDITADITDINGETRSATTTVNVGYHALTAQIIIANQLDKEDNKQTFSVDTRNLNGEFVPAKGNIKIYKLNAPNTVLRRRPWTAPDYQEFTKEQFKTLFLNEAYTNEHDSKNWDKGALVYDEDFNTETSKELQLGKIKRWESGAYIVVLKSKDRFGQTVKDEAQTIVYSDNDKTLADNQLFNITTNKSSYGINDTVELVIGSSAEGLFLTLEIEKNHEIISKQIIELNNDKKTIKIPVSENDLGGFAVHYSYAFKNSFKSGRLNINVPYPKTDLDIETQTFRDKLQPGTDETWRFKIKGPKGDKVAAELLASMYDASLDQFKSHNWSFEPISQPSYYSSYRLNSGRSFMMNQFVVDNLLRQSRNYSVQKYDALNFFQVNFNDYYYGRQQYLWRVRNSSPSTFTSKYIKSQKTGIVKGLIKGSDGIPVPGVSLIVNDNGDTAYSDFDGEFSINVKKGDIIKLSFVGLKGLEIKISNDNYFDIILYEDLNSLEPVRLSSYHGLGNQRNVASALVSHSPESIVLDENEDYLRTNFDKADDRNFRDGDSRSQKENVEQAKEKQNFDDVKIRKNLQETAFFFPQLQTDKDGNVSFSFTTPEALTKWKLQLLAHTKTLESATTTLETVTQKELMVIPNAPRFLREGDNISISTKIANLTETELNGVAVLQLFDAITGESIDQKLSNSDNELDFNVSAKGNTNITWNLDIPYDVDAVQYKIIAKAGNFSDGEQNALPVLSNRMLVTETIPMWIKSNETRTFTLDKLATTTSTTLKHHKLTLEMTSNPAWYAVQALPYLMEYPYECNEQTFSRYYANALASHIANSNPRIQEVFNQWRNTDALLSNLEKNQDLKSILIQETPWLRDAQSETEQKKRIALLFDLNKMNNELEATMRKLKNGQMSNGAWSWFNGGRPNRYITQHIITGFGHLDKLNVTQSYSESAMIEKAISYLDAEFVQEYKDIKKYNPEADLNKDHLSYTQLHYLYMRSFFPQIKKSKEVEAITDYYQTQIQKYWSSRSLYAKGLMTLVLHRMDDKSTSAKILESLKETSITSEELGMYWKSNTNSWYWYQAPIETQALLIETFSEAGSIIQSEAKNLEDIDNLKIWLLKNKQTNRWKTTKATTEAVYALLLQGSDWLSVTDMVDIVLGSQHIDASKLEDVKVEAGTGYFKTSWSSSEIEPDMATVKLTKKGDGIAWGSLYWQYFENLDKITSAETPLKLSKTLFKKTNTDTGEQITEITANTNLNVGDLVRVRIELRSDRAMEFVHMKDMRAAGLEPVNVMSQYKYQDGLGYYEATKDASTNFFFDYLPKGVYVFEYDLRVNNAGDMSNGITTIQSMYAPEFSSHSEGVRISVDSEK